jgi:hypothetical protein
MPLAVKVEAYAGPYHMRENYRGFDGSVWLEVDGDTRSVNRRFVWVAGASPPSAPGEWIRLSQEWWLWKGR